MLAWRSGPSFRGFRGFVELMFLYAFAPVESFVRYNVMPCASLFKCKLPTSYTSVGEGGGGVMDYCITFGKDVRIVFAKVLVRELPWSTEVQA